ncbi:spore germination protein GerPC [Paenibacillus xerothermodurans]|uniref:spore germination protein GerPC n=1 Tax=Paenibacillus xerothermodurans TaxID=1977292 RepID=UPI001402E234|nr:spore germination protein GerPC [Paenibacillus xerothermodurans]
MNYWHQLAATVHQMHGLIGMQTRQIADMERRLSDMQSEMNMLRDQKRIHIDRVEYKFDQLKVEQLDGTLNIGLTPGTWGDLDVGSTGATDSEAAEEEPDDTLQPGDLPARPGVELANDISRELDKYMNEQVPQHIERLQAQSGHYLNKDHQNMIIEDLKKQIEHRIKHYLQQMSPGAIADQLPSIKDSVLFRTQNDIRKALANYFHRLPKKDVGE